MNINQLTYFVSVAENRSFTKAAQQCYLTQTAISQQMQSLETLLDVQLINRNSRPIELTPAGHIFYAEAKEILAHVRLAMQEARDASRGVAGMIRIGYAKTFENTGLPQLFLDFHRKYPSLALKLFCTETDQLSYGLLNNDYDIIFTWDSSGIVQEPSLTTRVVEKITSVVLVYPNHPFARRENLGRSDLKGERLFFLTPSSTGSSFADVHYLNMYQEAGYQPDIVMKSSDLSSVLMMVSLEQGIALIPSYCMRQISLYQNLIGVPMTNNDEYLLGVWKEDNSNTALRYFLEDLPEI